MCCIAEALITFFGLAALFRGRLDLSRDKVVAGVPARVVGLILVLASPLAIAISVGVSLAIAYSRGRPPSHEFTSILSIVLLIAFLLAALTVAVWASRSPLAPPAPTFGPPENFPPGAPPDPQNPYSAPQS